MNAPAKRPPVDVTTLRPGYRIRVRDWRDGQLYDATFIGHIESGGARHAVFPPSLPERRRRGFRVSVYRDGFVDERLFTHSDVVEQLVVPTPKERGQWMARVVQAMAVAPTPCTGCLGYIADRRRDGTHLPKCPGLTLVPELDELVGTMTASRSP